MTWMGKKTSNNKWYQDILIIFCRRTSSLVVVFRDRVVIGSSYITKTQKDRHINSNKTCSKAREPTRRTNSKKLTQLQLTHQPRFSFIIPFFIAKDSFICITISAITLQNLPTFTKINMETSSSTVD